MPSSSLLGCILANRTTLLFFFTIYFFNKKVDLSSLRGGGGAGAPIAPPSLRAWCYFVFLLFVSKSRVKCKSFLLPIVFLDLWTDWTQPEYCYQWSLKSYGWVAGCVYINDNIIFSREEIMCTLGCLLCLRTTSLWDIFV